MKKDRQRKAVFLTLYQFYFIKSLLDEQDVSKLSLSEKSILIKLKDIFYSWFNK